MPWTLAILNNMKYSDIFFLKNLNIFLKRFVIFSKELILSTRKTIICYCIHLFKSVLRHGGKR